ncbi:RHS repeat-associated core domain-containing protein [Xanthomonas theicola]|uniref:RHS repeat-associated core domain-containing protein n=1 Tax=Xanthomonas theicola TaxID=56464 RepID=UPI003AA7FEFD
MTYRYNGRGEQVQRSGAATTTTVYDEAGHWLGDYDGNGVPVQQAIWLDDLPVGVLAKNSLRYVQPDHLGTPRAVIDPVRDVAIWRWDLKGEAFGNTSPDQDPDKDGTAFVFDMRFPGQRYDAASGLNYNYFRDYEPGTGRYAQSDPIGLEGGISSYIYALGSPVRYVDPLGLVVKVCRDPAFNGRFGSGIKHNWITTDTQSAGMGTPAAGANAGNEYDPLGARVETVDHSNRSDNGDRECEVAKGANEEKVNKLIRPGRHLGIFVPGFNDCQVFVRDVLRQSGGEWTGQISVDTQSPLCA